MLTPCLGVNEAYFGPDRPGFVSRIGMRQLTLLRAAATFNFANGPVPANMDAAPVMVAGKEARATVVLVSQMQDGGLRRLSGSGGPGIMKLTGYACASHVVVVEE